MNRRACAERAGGGSAPLSLRRWRRAGAVLVLGLAVAAGSACEPRERERRVDVEVIDSVLAELGGPLTARMSRGQRWRMISSIGVGLPPNDFAAEDLPEPGSRGAGLLQVYCTQCHWLPTPQMHSADEWPILVNRNLLRMEQLKNRLGGPLTRGMVGEVVLAGYESVEVPDQADVDTLLAYLQEHAFPTAQPGELTDGPGREVFLGRCSICHETPSPQAHTASGWERLIGQMQAYMQLYDVEPLSSDELDRVTEYLRGRAAR